jgi:hypothetical protein
VLPTPAWADRLVFPVSFYSSGSSCWWAQRRSNRSTYGATMDVEMRKLRGGSWWRCRWEVFEPWYEGIAIHIGISSVWGWSWTGKGRGSRTWVVGSTRARVVRGAWTSCCRNTENVHAFYRFASLKKEKKWWNQGLGKNINEVIKSSPQITWRSDTGKAIAKNMPNNNKNK